MRRSNVVRAQSRPFRIEPEFGKVTEHSLESQPKVAWDVLQERESGSYLAKDSSELGPEVSFIVFASLFACHRERLARIAAADHVNLASPLRPVERPHVLEDRRVVEQSVADARPQDLLRVLVTLDVGHRGPAEQVLRGEQAAAAARE